MPCPRQPPVPFRPGVPFRAAKAPRPRGESLEVCSGVCPLCRGPMTPRLSRAGPYFHCLCYERGEKR